MKALFSNIRAWKNRVFPDWLWDLTVGAALTVLSLIALPVLVWLGVPFDCSLIILALPFSFTVWNQFYNRIFELKDFLLRMVVPGIVYMIIVLI